MHLHNYPIKQHAVLEDNWRGHKLRIGSFVLALILDVLCRYAFQKNTEFKVLMPSAAQYFIKYTMKMAYHSLLVSLIISMKVLPMWWCLLW